MDKAEILKLSISKLKVAIALALGLAVYDRKIGNDNNAPRYALTEAGDTEIPSGWERVVDIAKVPDVGFITITCDEYWLATRPSSPSYLRSQLKSEDGNDIHAHEAGTVAGSIMDDQNRGEDEFPAMESEP